MTIGDLYCHSAGGWDSFREEAFGVSDLTKVIKNPYVVCIGRFFDLRKCSCSNWYSISITDWERDALRLNAYCKESTIKGKYTTRNGM